MIAGRGFYILISLSFTITAYISYALMIALLMNSFYVTPLIILILYLIEKVVISFQLSNLFLLIIELLDLDYLYSPFTDSFQILFEKLLVLIGKMSIRFFFATYLVMELNLFISPSYENLPQYCKMLSLIFYYCIILQSCFIMYIFNTYHRSTQKYYFFFSQFISYIIRTCCNYGLRLLFLIYCRSYQLLIIIIVKLIFVSIASFLVSQPQLELHDLSDKKQKILLTFAIVSLSFITDFSPFDNYGQTSKIDLVIDRKLCSQLSIIIIRGIQFLESIFLFIEINKDKNFIISKGYLPFGIFLTVTGVTFYLNIVFSLCSLMKATVEYLTDNFTYYSALSLELSKAQKIFKSSENLISIEILSLTSNEITNQEKMQFQFGFQSLCEILWSKIFLQVPSQGFRRIYVRNVIYLDNQVTILKPKPFIKHFIEYYKSSSDIAPRKIIFSETIPNEFSSEIMANNQNQNDFNFNDQIQLIKSYKQHQFLSSEQKKILYECLIERLFSFGFCDQIEKSFPFGQKIAISFSKSFENQFLYILVFGRIIGPLCSFNPVLAIFDIFID